MSGFRPWPELGMTIKRLRKDRGWTLEEFGKQTGLSAAYLSELERDRKNPPLSTCRVIAHALGLGWLDFWREVEK